MLLGRNKYIKIPRASNIHLRTKEKFTQCEIIARVFINWDVFGFDIHNCTNAAIKAASANIDIIN